MELRTSFGISDSDPSTFGGKLSRRAFVCVLSDFVPSKLTTKIQTFFLREDIVT